MDVKIPLADWPPVGYEPGKIVLIGRDSGTAYGLSIAWGGGEASFLILDGDDAGQLDAFTAQRTALSAGDIQLRVSRRSSDWMQGSTKSKAPLSVCYANGALYFVFIINLQPWAVNAATGLIDRLPIGGFCTDAWGVYENGAKSAFIGKDVD